MCNLFLACPGYRFLTELCPRVSYRSLTKVPATADFGSLFTGFFKFFLFFPLIPFVEYIYSWPRITPGTHILGVLYHPCFFNQVYKTWAQGWLIGGTEGFYQPYNHLNHISFDQTTPTHALEQSVAKHSIIQTTTTTQKHLQMAEEYTYQPLDNSKHEIRLLKILRRDICGAEIFSQLNTVPLVDAADTYIAC